LNGESCHLIIYESLKNKKVKKQPASSPHVDGKYHPFLLDVAELTATIIAL